MKITEADARVICEMAYWCMSESVGPDFNDLLKRIDAEFPDIDLGRDAVCVMAEVRKSGA